MRSTPPGISNTYRPPGRFTPDGKTGQIPTAWPPGRKRPAKALAPRAAAPAGSLAVTWRARVTASSGVAGGGASSVSVPVTAAVGRSRGTGCGRRVTCDGNVVPQPAGDVQPVALVLPGGGVPGVGVQRVPVVGGLRGAVGPGDGAELAGDAGPGGRRALDRRPVGSTTAPSPASVVPPAAPWIPRLSGGDHQADDVHKGSGRAEVG